MWASAQAADTQTAWQQVNAWRRTHDLLLHHAGRLKASADELSYAWPPGRSPAAQAFIEYITQLRETILMASVEAATNYTAIAGVLTSLSAAKADMAKLKQEWDSHQTASATEKIVLQEQINARARSRMAKNDQEVLEASRRFVNLPPTQERPIGPTRPWGPNPEGGVTAGSAPAVRLGGGPLDSRLIAPSIESVDTAGGQIGLAGASAGQKPSSSVDASMAGNSPGLLPASGATQNPGLGAIGRVPVTHTPAGGEPSRLSRSGNPHIGSSGAAGRAMPTAPLVVGPSRGQGKVNPVGGVIEAGRPASAASTLPFMGGARGAGGTRPASTAPPLTMLWDVVQGVSPVIEPLPEPPFELGPGVIGIDK
jgi:hypothetical protein